MKKVNLRDLYPDVYKIDHFVFPRAYGAAALRQSEPPFLFLFRRCSCDQEGGIIGGHRHVKFRHS